MTRGLTRRWIFGANGDSAAPLLERILTARQLDSPERIERFCRPKLTHLHDPALLPDVDRAVERIVRGLRDGETIAIYGDYDVDGITATAVLVHVIRALDPAARLVRYVPHRLEEGYGINADALASLREQGATLVISVDCGVTAVEPARRARELGLDLIITDHHAPGAELPEAFAIVHPGLPGSSYPYRELCGAGVAFKLAWRLATTWCGSDRVPEPVQRTLLDVLPLVALGTIADVVPLVDENRVLASFGLRWIKQTPLVGLKALIEAADLADQGIDSEKVGFILAPRLNACGRMGHAAEAMHLLTDAGPEEAMTIARRLTEQNRERQATEREIVEQAAQRAIERGMTGDDVRAIVLADPAWHPGVVGIVCSRLAERFGRPAILMQEQEGICAGSARSIDGYSIHAGLSACADHLLSFGGHEQAAGLRLETRNLDAFTDALVAHANEAIDVEQLTAPLTIDCDAALHELEHGVVQRIAELAPFGRANRRPTLRLRDLTLAEPPRPVGRTGRHIIVRLCDAAPGGNRSERLRGIWWNGADQVERLVPGLPLDVAIEPKLNCFRGRVSVEGEVRDVMLRG